MIKNSNNQKQIPRLNSIFLPSCSDRLWLGFLTHVVDVITTCLLHLFVLVDKMFQKVIIVLALLVAVVSGMIAHVPSLSFSLYFVNDR